MQGIFSDFSQLQLLYTPGDEFNDYVTGGEEEDEKEGEAEMTDHYDPKGGDISYIKDEGQVDVVIDIADDK